jgi:hypothetical protein
MAMRCSSSCSATPISPIWRAPASTAPVSFLAPTVARKASWRPSGDQRTVLATPLMVATVLNLPSRSTWTVAVPALLSVLISAIALPSGDHTGASMRQPLQSDCSNSDSTLPVAVSRTTMRGAALFSPSTDSSAAMRSPSADIASER